LWLRTAVAAFIINNHDEGFTFRNIVLSWKIKIARGLYVNTVPVRAADLGSDRVPGGT
jgi:hypothetical protein